MDVKQLIKNLVKVFPNIPEVKSLASYILSNPDAKKEEVIAFWYGASKNLDKLIVNKVINVIESLHPKKQYAVELFTKELLRYAEAFSNNEFLLKLLVDVNNNKVYIVPAKEGHLKIAASILKLKNENEIYKNPQIAEHIVGCYVKIKDYKITEVLVGAVSGLTLGSHVKYSPENISKAYNIVSNFIFFSDFPYEARLKKVLGRK